MCDACYNVSCAKLESTAFATRGGSNGSSASPVTVLCRSSSQSHRIASPQSSAVDRQRRELFGSGSGSATPNASSPSVKTNEGNIAAAASQLNETQQRLQERGEKLSKLSDRTADMNNAAEEFEKMARQLNQQQKGWWFG